MESLTAAVTLFAVIVASGFVVGERNGELRSVRKKRNAFVYPPASALQLTIGVSAVLDLARNPSGQMSYAFQQNIALPANYTELLFPLTVEAKRSVSVRDDVRHFFVRSTANGTECLKKMICQMAETPLRDGLLEDILTFAFTPSNHEDLLGRGAEKHPLFVSESIGRSSGDCHSQFPDCQRTPLDLISQMDGDHPRSFPLPRKRG